MFIFNRSFATVGAALSVSLLIVLLDRACNPAPIEPPQSEHPVTAGEAGQAPEHATSRAYSPA